MDIRLRHRTIITRVPDNVNDAQPGSSRSKSPSHVRNRHLPVTQSAIKKRLSTKLEEAEEILAEDSNTGRAIPMKPTPDLPTRDGTRVPRQESDKPSVKARPRAGKNDLVLAAVEKTPINRPQYVTEHSFAPTPPAMIRKSTELSPVLPITWQYAVGTPSSFEQALDDVVRKLDEMETKPAIHELEVTLKSKRRSPDVKQAQPDVPHLKEAPPAFAEHRRQPGDGESEKSKAMTTDTSSSSFAYHRLQRAAAMRRQRIAAGDGAQSSRPPEDAVSTTASDIGLDTGPPGPSPTNGLPHIGDLSSSNKTTETAKSFSVEEVVVEHHDRDIEDRDVLKGLKLAITAACDENLDAWIRGRTGLRLRRFLADLKTFEALDMEDQVGAQGTAKRPLKDQVDAKDAETDPATTKITAKATNKGRVAEGQPVGSNGKPRSSAGIGRHNPDQNEVKEPENRPRKTRADERNTQAEKVTEEEKKHKHLLRVEA
ncbi:hypothetical protein DL546_000426 [Coniochaeta pulveracea]|uniref:Uncharacterized protein n=1 Tax=Coniochaeta pulveracea TaxID=177199 RepID=A0A420Y138_9PEZI|nr:hypothetical protein DL546_000426 [Coniochaeta pulveracea]